MPFGPGSPADRPQNHPLRQCAMRLKVKAEQLLKNITDRKERIELPIPSDISRGSTPRLNGNGVNGHSVARPRPVAFTKSPSPVKAFGSSSSAVPRRGSAFEDSPAIVRTAEGMAEFMQFDRELDALLEGQFHPNGFHGPGLEERLREYAVVAPVVDGEGLNGVVVDGEVGEKRKL